MEFRCQGRLHGIVDSEGHLEVKCRDRYCGAGDGYVVFHKFNIETGSLEYTARFKDPRRNE